MALQPFSDEQLNYFKFASIVLNEFASALRQTFKTMWDNSFSHRPGYQLWDDSTAVRNLFLATEGGKTKVPTHFPYEEWDCTALFQATIYARSFALLDSSGHLRTLGELYVKHHKIPHGKFHASVVSSGGNKAETFALAIDQLRLLRNSLCHADKSEIDKSTFDQYVQHAKEAFKALGVNTDAIDAIGGLKESDFPTKEVRKLEVSIKQETQAYIKFLESMSSDIETIKGRVEGAASREDIALLERKIDDLMKERAQDQTDSKPYPPPSCLPPMVPHFTGRQRECEDIVDHLTSKSTRVVSIWGSPGFGKTSVATALGHQLQSEGLPVYFFSLRGLQSKTDLTSKLLSFFKRASTKDQIPQRLSIDEELCLLLTGISEDFVMILDNADDLLESGAPNVKEDFINLLRDILSRNQRLRFVITTRESLEFMNVHFQGHQAVRIGPLHESFSETLASGLLPSATASDCKQIAKICGNVPLAVKLLCSSISEDNAQPSRFLEDFKESLESNIVELLDNPDYPSDLRLKFLFESSFERLSAQEQRALVSLSILSESFNLSVAAAVMGVKTNLESKKILNRLRRKSLLDSSYKPESFSMHKLLLSFAREKGDDEMKDTLLNSKARLRAFYVSLFEKLNEQFLTGHSMSAFVDFYEEKQNIIQSLVETCSDPKTCDAGFGILSKAELFLDSLFWCEIKTINKIYDSATEAAKKLGKHLYYRQLLVSLAFAEVTWGTRGRTMKLLSEADDKQVPCSSFSVSNKGKLMCYRGICQLASGKTDEGVHNLKESLSLMNDSPEHRVLRITVLQILVIYYRLNKNLSMASQFYDKAMQECKTAGDTSLLVIVPLKNKEIKINQGEVLEQPDALFNHPLRLEIICVAGISTEQLSDGDSRQSISKAVQKIAREIEKPMFPRSLGLCIFQRNVNVALKNVLGNPDQAAKFSAAIISYHEMALHQIKSNMSESHRKSIENLSLNAHQEALLKSYLDHGRNLHDMQKYSEALQSKQRALDMSMTLFGENHPDTAQSYYSLGLTQNELGDFTSALHSQRRALAIRVKLFGEEHSDTAKSYYSLAVAQHNSGDLTSSLQCHQRALAIRVKLFGEEHSDTAQSYHSLGVTQHALGDFTSALRAKQRVLAIRVKLFGEEHSDTAESYYSLAATQHNLGDYNSALQSSQRAFDTRVKLFGEEHSSTAKSYHLIGVTQHKLGDFTSALQSKQRALAIRVKLFGEEHSDTAQSYHSLGLTQHALRDFTSALQFHQRALTIRVKLFGEEHPDTTQSCHLLGVTQHALGDFTSALQSKQRALATRVKLYGEEHSDTAESYYSLAATQQNLGDFSSALQSLQLAFDIRGKLFEEEYSETA